MKNLLLLPLLCLLTLTLSAQPRGARCNYAELLRQGKAEAQKGAYPAALLKFNSARRCDPSKGDTIDAEIQKVFDGIEKQRREALEAKKQAQQEKNKAEKTLQELQKTTEEVVLFVLKDAEKLILNLDYEGAWEKLRTAADFKALTRKVALAMLEPAFWHAETGNYTRASSMLETIASLLNKRQVLGMLQELRELPQSDTVRKRNLLRYCVKELDAVAYDSLQRRYYPTMVKVPGGTYTMGCIKPADCRDRPDSTLFRPTVSDFEIAETETTVWQWSIFCAATKQEIKKFLEPWADLGNNPVVNATWYESVAYANWLNARYWRFPSASTVDSAITQNSEQRYQLNLNAKGFRLPTEAEWEYAARGGHHRDTTKYSGSDDPDKVAWYNSNSNSRTQAVKGKALNSLKLADMSGNVWEWCWDLYSRDLKGSQENPIGPDSGSFGVLRGGSWGADAEVCRVAYRRSYDPSDGNDYYGFRLARTP